MPWGAQACTLPGCGRKPDCKAKGNLHEDTKEAFCSLMLKIEDEEDQLPPQSARKFVVGPVKALPGTPQKAWDEVKSSDRTSQLREMLPDSERVSSLNFSMPFTR